MPKEFGPKYSEGHDVEESVLGKVEPGARLSHEEYLEKKEREEFRDITWKQAFNIVKKHQPFKDPSFPKEKIFPRQLLKRVQDLIGLECCDQLKYYTGVGSLIDEWKGDAIIELIFENGEILHVTLDITIDPEKLPFKKADVPFLWTAHRFDKKDPEEQNLYKIHYDKSLEEVSESVFNVFKGKAEESGLVISSLSLEQIQEIEKFARQNEEKRFLQLPRIPFRRRVYVK